MMTTRQGTKSVFGTKLSVGDVRSLGWNELATITAVVQGRHPFGARYADVTTDDGETSRCWEGFGYMILVDIVPVVA